jgi:hypothetical protein
MSKKITFIVSIPDNPSANIAFYEVFLKACEDANVPVRYELYESDMYHDLNLKALDIEKSYALNELEDEILNNLACVNGSCED